MLDASGRAGGGTDGGILRGSISAGGQESLRALQLLSRVVTLPLFSSVNSLSNPEKFFFLATSMFFCARCLLCL